MELIKLEELGIHDGLDDNIEDAYQVLMNGSLIGYVSFITLKDVAHVSFILAVNPGEGEGKNLVASIFETGVNKISGSAIVGPHAFWESIGAEFEFEMDEDDYEGNPFVLTKEKFEVIV